MIYRRFGRTGLQMPVLSAGCMRTMHSWQVHPQSEIPPASQLNLTAIAARALELGINHFETARGYGTSEMQLGRALKTLAPRDAYILQTKIQPTKDPALFRDHFYDSIARLGVERIDLLAIHGINDYQSLWQVCRPGGCLAAARELQKEGRAGFIGFSGHGSLPVILEAIRHEKDGGFDYLNLHWYYVFQGNSPALEEAAAHDMGVFIISPTDKGGMLQHPPARMRELCSPLSPIAFNDCWCLSRPEVHTISIGASRLDDFDEHVNALPHLEDGGTLLAGIDQRCRREMVRRTGHDRPEGLWSAFPPWSATPGYINIPFILWLHNLARGWGLVEYGRRRYRKLGSDVKWVPGNNAAAAGRYNLGAVAAGAGIEPEELVRQLGEAHALLGHPPGSETG